MSTNEKRRRMNRRQALGLLLAFIVALVAGDVYLRKLRNRGTVVVTFISPDGTSETTPFRLEVARDPAERNKGLMFRKALDSASGMIFVFPDEAQRSFWMENTYIPLDMIFVRSSLQIVDVIPNVPMLTREHRVGKGAAQYVIELTAGQAAQHKIAPTWNVKLKEGDPKLLSTLR